MAFVKRNEAGEVVAVSQLAEPGMTEEVSAEDAEVKQFFASIHPEKPSLDASDDDFIRVLEDVVELLRKALSLQVRLPPEPERDAQELSLNAALGPPLVALEGYAAQPVITVYERILAMN